MSHEKVSNEESYEESDVCVDESNQDDTNPPKKSKNWMHFLIRRKKRSQRTLFGMYAAKKQKVSTKMQEN